MPTIRPPAVAGLFYPDNPAVLQEMVEGFLKEAGIKEKSGSSATVDPTQEIIPKALIAPHAGFVYSGPIAASAYRLLTPARGKIRKVVLLGPSHRVGFRGLAVTSADFFHTPLGDIPIEQGVISTLKDLPQVVVLDTAHAEEHSLEVHLPFLQEVLGDFALVPLVVGNTHPEEVSEVLGRLWGEADTLIVISSDLSHYLPYNQARRQDDATAHAIERLDPKAMHSQDACGMHPINGLLHLAKQRQMTVERLDLRNSGDTAGDKKRVVGYGAWAFFDPEITGQQALPGKEENSVATGETTSDDQEAPAMKDDTEFSADERRTLLTIAADSIRHGLTHKKPLPVDSTAIPSGLGEKCATFVTLEKDGKLRGCIGSLQATRPLLEDVAHNAFQAAFRDPRFPLVTKEEFEQLDIKLSLLTSAEPMQFDSEDDLLRQLRPGVDGLILAAGPHRATFLPAVWESLPDPVQFLRHLKMKAGLSPGAWPANITVSRYRAESIEQSE